MNDHPTTVELLDGRTVSTYSPEWREECRVRETEARAILKMADVETRRAHLATIEERSGLLARQRMEAAILGLWEVRSARARG